MMSQEQTVVETAESPSPEVMPQPTYAPVAMALGVMLLVWGIQTKWPMSLGGALLIIWALSSWMGQICHDWKLQDDE